MSVHVQDIGQQVICDGSCGEDYTGKPDSGGILFGSYAMCPKCAPRVEATAAAHGETSRIKARCPEGMPFAAWVLSLRGGDNRIVTYSGEDAVERRG